MEQLKNFSNIELIKELMNRSITEEELDKICETDYPNDVITIENYSTNEITIKFWGSLI